ncbi:hypothetical protein ABIB85_007514 [Bradyrhizobium sp. JR1.5]|uniref:hypothetical protein n=1 Tax=unclassified Bradyrhizobium TaxID=2631580 RepID=UPI002449DCC1|nr:hypothetical protein [Bradyrhizobium sp. SSUT18]MDH2399223.1 hypothetical protein [Bradyrhizobium sp. SSUT18]
MAKGKKGKPAKKNGKPAKKQGSTMSANFAGMAGSFISRDEIYHRLEWYFDHSHNPKGPHTIDPNTPIDAFFENMDPSTGRKVLWVNINKISPTFVPAWKSALFHGVQFPWLSKKDVAIGLRDIQSFGNLIDSAVLTYEHFGWHVS